MLVSYLPFRLAQKHYFSAAAQLQYGAFTRHADTPCIDSDCNCCVSLQITASRPSATLPARLGHPFSALHHSLISPSLPSTLYYHRISRVLPFSCIVHGNSESCRLETSECASNEIGSLFRFALHLEVASPVNYIYL